MRSSRLSFRVVLPVLALLLSMTVVLVPATLTYVRLRAVSAHGRDVLIRYKGGSFTVPAKHVFRYSLLGAASITSPGIQAMNLPGMVGEAVASVATRSWPNSWRPRSFGGDPTGPFYGSIGGLFMWRSFAFPFYCLPFWWFAGLGVDGALGRGRLRWPVSLIGTLLSVVSVVLLLRLRFGLSASEREGVVYPLWGFVLWAVLFGVFPVGWVRNFLKRGGRV